MQVLYKTACFGKKITLPYLTTYQISKQQPYGTITNLALLVVTASRFTYLSSRRTASFCTETRWRSGNFTSRPQNQTFSIAELIFMGSPSNQKTLAQQWVKHRQQWMQVGEKLSKKRRRVLFYTSVFISRVRTHRLQAWHHQPGWRCQRTDHPSMFSLWDRLRNANKKMTSKGLFQT